MNLGDQANLAALLRSLVWGGGEKEITKADDLLQANGGFALSPEATS